MIAHRVAAPVLDHAGRGRVAGVVGGAAYLDLGGFVVAVTARGVPLMPNGIALVERSPAWPAPRSPLRLAAGGLSASGWRVSWPAHDPPVWDPVLPRLAPALLRERGEAIARAAPPSELAEPLARALAARDARPARALIGRGGGLTPEGDDLLAGAMAVAPWLAAALPKDLRACTTALSATLLELAAGGAVMEPVHGLFGPRWEAALRRLVRIGHSTGRAYAAGIGVGSRAT